MPRTAFCGTSASAGPLQSRQGGDIHGWRVNSSPLCPPSLAAPRRSCASPMKRKAGKDAAPQRVECPACGRCMPLAYIGLHLDSCVSGSSASGPSAAAAPPPPPALSLPSPPLPSLRGLVQQQQQQQQQPGHDSAQARRPGKEPGTSQAEGWPAGSSAAASEAAGSPPPPPPPAGRPASSSNSGSVTQPPWWQRVPAAPAAVGFKPGGQRLALRADALLATAYSELVPNFLPAELAEAVLREMQADSPGWGHMQWWGLGRGGKTAQQPGASSKTSSHYSFTDEAPAGGPREQHEQQQVGGRKAEGYGQACQHGCSMADSSAAVCTLSHGLLTLPCRRLAPAVLPGPTPAGARCRRRRRRCAAPPPRSQRTSARASRLGLLRGCPWRLPTSQGGPPPTASQTVMPAVQPAWGPTLTG